MVEEETLEAFAEITCIFVLDPVLTMLLEPNMQFRTVFVASFESTSRLSCPTTLPEIVEDRTRGWKVPNEALRVVGWASLGLSGLLGD